MCLLSQLFYDNLNNTKGEPTMAKSKKTFEPDTRAYRGYLIRFHPIRQTFMVQKDGFHICWALTMDEALKSIDRLFPEGNTQINKYQEHWLYTYSEALIQLAANPKSSPYKKAFFLKSDTNKGQIAEITVLRYNILKQLQGGTK